MDPVIWCVRCPDYPVCFGLARFKVGWGNGQLHGAIMGTQSKHRKRAPNKFSENQGFLLVEKTNILKNTLPAGEFVRDLRL